MRRILGPIVLTLLIGAGCTSNSNSEANHSLTIDEADGSTKLVVGENTEAVEPTNLAGNEESPSNVILEGMRAEENEYTEIEDVVTSPQIDTFDYEAACKNFVGEYSVYNKDSGRCVCTTGYTYSNGRCISQISGTEMPSPYFDLDDDADGMDTIQYYFRNDAKIIVECDGEYNLLGTISSKYDPDSVFNKYGDYGSKYSNESMWYKYGDYGGKYSDCSPFNKYGNAPMVIIEGDVVGYISTNGYAGAGVVSPNNLLLFGYLEYDNDYYLELMID